MWMAPIGHAPHDWHPPSVKTDDGDDDESAAALWSETSSIGLGAHGE
jgi:hypothetical protein